MGELALGWMVLQQKNPQYRDFTQYLGVFTLILFLHKRNGVPVAHGAEDGAVLEGAQHCY